MCISEKAQQTNTMDEKGYNGDFSAAFCQNNSLICSDRLAKRSMGALTYIDSFVTPIRTGPHTVVEPTPIAPKGTLQAVPRVETLPGKMKQYCDEYIAALSHLFPQAESSSRKQTPQHIGEQSGSATLDQESFSIQGSACFIDKQAPTESWHADGGAVTSNPSSQSSSAADPSKRVHPYQQERWMERYQDLSAFFHQHGHVNVPYVCNENPCLGQWVKRQRHQHKLLKQGIHSNLDESRIQALSMLGFIWDSHGAAWEEKFQEMKEFYQLHGHTNVPCIYHGGSQLSTWIKRQRRQYRLLVAGKTSTMDRVRISRLEAIGFVWDYYGSSKGNTA